MNKEIEILKSRIKNTKNNIFSLFKVETISNLIIYFEQLQIENKQLKEQLEKERQIRKEAIDKLKKWGEEPDCDMYMKIKEYKEHKEILDILDKGE